MEGNSKNLGLSPAERQQRAAELRRAQEEKERRMRALQAEFLADREYVRPHQRVLASDRVVGGVNAAVNETTNPRQEERGTPAHTPEPSVAAAAAAAAARAAAAAATLPAANPPAARKAKTLVAMPTPPCAQFQEGGIPDDERLRRISEIKRQQREREQARRDIAKEFKADHNFCRGVSMAGDGGGPAATAAVSPAGAAAPVATNTPSDSTCMVQLRLPNGQVRQREFDGDQLLEAVLAWAQVTLRQQGTYETCKLVLPPRQVLGEEEAAQTLQHLGLLPRVSFNVQLHSADGRVTAAPRAGSEFEASFRGEIACMLESEGFTAWEADEWGAVVQGQLQRGEMRKARSSVRALFGGLRLPTTIGAWSARVDQAPVIPEPIKPLDPALRLRQEFLGLSEIEREGIGFAMSPLPCLSQPESTPCPASTTTPTPAPRVCTLRIHKLAPESGLGRDLKMLSSENESSLPQELVVQVYFGSDFPFEAPSVRLVYPILTNIPLASAACSSAATASQAPVQGADKGEAEELGGACRQVSLSVGMALQAGGAAIALQSAKCARWGVNMGQSWPRFAGWLRNWLIGCGARVDSGLSQNLPRNHARRAPGGSQAGEGSKHWQGGEHWYLPTVGGLWMELRIVLQDAEGEEERVSLPVSLRVMQVTNEQRMTEGLGDVQMHEAEEHGPQGGQGLLGGVEASRGEGDDLLDKMDDDEEEEEAEEQRDEGVEDMRRKGLWVVAPVAFVEISTRGSWANGGGRSVVRAVTSWDAAPGTVAVSAAVARRLAALKHMDAKEHDPGSCATDANVQVRGVEVREASRVECSAPTGHVLFRNLPAHGAEANALRYNLADIAKALAARTQICSAPDTVSVSLEPGRTIRLRVVRVEPFDHSVFTEKTDLTLVPAPQ